MLTFSNTVQTASFGVSFFQMNDRQQNSPRMVFITPSLNLLKNSVGSPSGCRLARLPQYLV